jgi:hypothetical protein
MKPSVFVGSSTESLPIAYAIQQNLEIVSEVTVWTQGIFELSKFSIDSLLDTVEGSDFGVFVFSPDDVSIMRGKEKSIVRDNVIFELGLFVGRLGREKNFIVLPRGCEDNFHLPTDLLGVTPLYESNRQDGNLRAALGPACSKMTKAIEKLGHFISVAPAPPLEAPTLSVNYSEGDKKAILASWMGERPASLNTRIIHFAEVDRELKLEPGTTKKYIKEIAARWNYASEHEGEQTVLFHEVRTIDF